MEVNKFQLLGSGTWHIVISQRSLIAINTIGIEGSVIGITIR